MILAFDTSGPHCAIAIADGSTLRAERWEAMAKGQAEHLMPLITDTLAEARITPQELTAIGVGTGPGNFTGIRIAVSAARGLALALNIPAFGVTTFEALIGHGAEEPAPQTALVTLPGPRDTLYAQAFGTHDTAPRLLTAEIDLPQLEPRADPIHITPKDAEIPLRDWRPLVARQDGLPLAPSIARITARRQPTDTDWPRPKPLYLKPADAAPGRQAAPKIL